MSSKKNFLLTVMSASCLFLLFKLVFRFPYSTDDFVYLYADAENRLQLPFFRYYMARVPLWCLGVQHLFTSGLARQETVIYTVAFILNATFLLLISLRLRELITEKGQISKYFWVLAFLFTFYPNDHEVLFWLSCLPYAFGLVFLWAGWVASKNWQKVMLYLMAYCFGEMYLLPSLALELFSVAFPGQHNSKVQFNEILKKSVTKGLFWTLPVGLFLILRGILAQRYGAYPHTFNQSLGIIPTQLSNMMSHFFIMDFYKVFWGPTVLYWLALMLAVVVGLRQGKLTPRIVRFSACFILLSGALVFAMGYFAPRALFGASVCVNALLIVLLEVSVSEASKTIRNLVISLVGLSFIGQSLLVFSLKDANSRILSEKERYIVSYLTSCESNCEISRDKIASGFARGWVLHSDYVREYVEWIKLKHGLKVEVKYVP